MYSRSSGLTTVKTTSAPSRAAFSRMGRRGLSRANAGVKPDVRPRVRELEHGRADDLLGRLARRVAEDFDASSLQSQAPFDGALVHYVAGRASPHAGGTGPMRPFAHYCSSIALFRPG